MATEQLSLPLAWAADANLALPGSGHLRRWGSVEKACKMLDDCDRQ